MGRLGKKRALPLLRTIFPFWFVVVNRTSSSLSAIPMRHILVINLSPGLTGEANLAWNFLSWVASLSQIFCKTPWHVELYVKRP